MHRTLLAIAALAMLPSSARASSLDTKQIDSTVRAKAQQFQDCYEEGLDRKPKLRGKAVMRFKVDRDGSVHEAGLTSSTLRDEKVEACLVGVFETMQFPELGPPCADGEDCRVTVNYPLTFAPEKDDDPPPARRKHR